MQSCGNGPLHWLAFMQAWACRGFSWAIEEVLVARIPIANTETIRRNRLPNILLMFASVIVTQ
jgi:hypothetical protein